MGVLVLYLLIVGIVCGAIVCIPLPESMDKFCVFLMFMLLFPAVVGFCVSLLIGFGVHYVFTKLFFRWARLKTRRY